MINQLMDNHLPERTLRWFAQAIAGMVASDGVVDEKEIEYLRKAIDFLPHKNKVIEIMEQVKRRELPELTQFREGNRTIAFRLYLNLAKVAIADDVFTEGEEKFLIYVGGKLGFNKDYCKKFATWARNQASCDRALVKLADYAQKVPAEYT